jgi:hypothetical protein
MAQCLCPDRHCILALAQAIEDDCPEDIARLLDRLQGTVDQALAERVINPWCGLCHAEPERWICEAGRTAFTTLAEAKPAIAESQARQDAVRTQFGDMDRRRPN